MNNVTTPARPDYGTVEYYADVIPQHADTAAEVRAVTVGIAGATVNYAHLTAEDQLARVRNALAAGEIVLEEMRQAGR